MPTGSITFRSSGSWSSRWWRMIRSVAERKAQQRRAEVQRFRADLAKMNACTREEAMDGPSLRPSARIVMCYGHDPRGWPPAWNENAWKGLPIQDPLARSPRTASSNRTGRPDAPSEHFAGAMARVKATLALLGASRP